MFKKLLLLILSVNFACSNTLTIRVVEKVSYPLCLALCCDYVDLESVELNVSSLNSLYSLEGIKNIFVKKKGWDIKNDEFRLKLNGSALAQDSNFPILPKYLYLLRSTQ